MTTDDVVLETLTEKIQRQDRFIAELQADLQRARLHCCTTRGDGD